MNLFPVPECLCLYSHKAGVNPEQGFFTHEVYDDEIFFKLAEAAVDIIGKNYSYYTRQKMQLCF